MDKNIHFGNFYRVEVEGGGAGNTLKINYKTLNEPPNAKSQQFFENQMSMRSHTKSVCRIW